MELNHKCNGCRYASEHQEMGFKPFGVCTKETNLIEAEKKYNADHCPYIVDAYAEGTAEELQKVFADLTGKKTEDFQKAVEAIQHLVESISEVLIPVMDAVLRVYPNKRVLHLAIHHPKERIRKKNMRRIMRWIERNEN